MFVSACEAWGVIYGFWGGVVPHKSKITYNLKYLARTVKCLDLMSITLFCIGNPVEYAVFGIEVWQVFFASVLAGGIQIPEKKCRQDNELDLVCEFPCICRLYLHSFPFLTSKSNYSFFKVAQFDSQAESIQMRDNCFLRLGSKQLLKVRAEF